MQEFHPTLMDEEVTASFRLKNTGSSPVRILSVSPDCGCCTTAQPSKSTIEAGESGEIGVRFKFEGRKGDQLRTIMVKTDDEKRKTLELKMRVHIPELFRIEPAELVWIRGESLSPKKVSLKLHPDLAKERKKVALKSLHISSQVFTGKVSETESGREWIIDVIPTETGRPASASAFVQSDAPIKKNSVTFEVSVK